MGHFNHFADRIRPSLAINVLEIIVAIWNLHIHYGMEGAYQSVSKSNL